MSVLGIEVGVEDDFNPYYEKIKQFFDGYNLKWSYEYAIEANKMLREYVEQGKGACCAIGNSKDKRFTKKSSYFTFLVYPDNPANLNLLYQLAVVEKFDVCFIEHAPDNNYSEMPSETDIERLDTDVEQTTYKKHIHVLFKSEESVSLNSLIRKLVKYQIFHVESVSSVKGLIRYFLHQTEEARADGKPAYQISDLYYQGEFINHVQAIERRLTNNKPFAYQDSVYSELYTDMTEAVWQGKDYSEWLGGVMWNQEYREFVRRHANITFRMFDDITAKMLRSTKRKGN